MAKNKAAAELGRLGGQKGGRARAKRLTPEERSAIARKAGLARAKKLSRAKRKEIARKGGLARHRSS